MHTEHPELRYADTVSHCKPMQTKELTWQSSQLFCPRPTWVMVNSKNKRDTDGHVKTGPCTEIQAGCSLSWDNFNLNLRVLPCWVVTSIFSFLCASTLGQHARCMPNASIEWSLWIRMNHIDLRWLLRLGDGPYNCPRWKHFNTSVIALDQMNKNNRR